LVLVLWWNPVFACYKLINPAVLVKEFYDKIKAELKLKAGENVAVFVNGLGGTPLMEQYVFMNDVLALLKADNIPVAKKYIGNKMTSIEMQGLSLTILRLKEAKWLDYLNQKVEVAAW